MNRNPHQHRGSRNNPRGRRRPRTVWTITNENYKYQYLIDLYVKNEDDLSDDIEELIDNYDDLFKERSLAPVNTKKWTFTDL